MKNTSQNFKKFRLIGKSLYFLGKRILVLGDLHIGYGEYLNEQGIFLPLRQFKEMFHELKSVFKEIEKIDGEKRVEEIVVLGDLKHGFGRISAQEWKETKEILDFFKKKSEKVVLVKGNHDTMLEPIAKRKELKIRDFYIKEGICFLHGHKLFPECLDKKVRMLVLGHKHPAVLLSDEYKKEKYKCFLFGKWKGKQVIIMPSFFPFIEGSDIINDYEENKLFISEKDLKEFDVRIPVPGEGEIYKFGKLKGLSLNN